MTSSNLPASPLARALAQTRATPRETGRTAQLAQRFVHSTDARVICADRSASMGEVARQSDTKATLLRGALASLTADVPQFRCIAFGGKEAAWADPADPAAWEPWGGTPLHLALELAATQRPRQTLVVTDGHPNDEEAALEAARQLPGRIDVLFIGPESDVAGQEFCRRLASVGSGASRTLDLVALGRAGRDTRASLAHATRTMLSLPPAQDSQ